MIAGLSWAQVLRDFAAHLHWTAHQVLEEQTFAVFWLVWCGAGERRGEHNHEAIRDKINRLRAKKGLPPMKPAPKKE